MTRPPYHRVNPTRPRPGRVPKQRSAPTPPPPRKGCWPPLVIGAVLVLGVSLILVPLATRVWTTAYIPAANRTHYGDGLIVALAGAGLLLYVLVSVLLVPRRPYSPAGSAAGCTVSSRPGTDAAGVLPASPGPSTPAATTTAGAA